MSEQLAATISQYEQHTGHDLTFMRAILRGSEEALTRFMNFMPLAEYGEAASKEALAVVRLVGTRSEDCGPCLQIVVDLAQKSGVDGDLIQAVLDRDTASMEPVLARVHAFAEAVCERSADAETLRLELEDELGHAVMVELALGIASTRLFPVVKRGLGFSESCSKVNVRVNAI